MANRWPAFSVRVALAYATFAGAWILFSDRIIERLAADPHTLTLAQTWKGLAFVAVTTALLYLLLRREFARRAVAERDRQRLDRQLRGVLENMTDGFVAIDRDWRYLYVNRHAGEMLGRDPQALIGGHIWELFPEGVGQPFYHAYHEVMRTGRPRQFEEHYQPWNRWFENRIYPVPDGIAIFFQDISERRVAEAALRENEERFRATFEQAAVGIAQVAPDGNFVRVNERLCDIVGYPRDELLQLRFQDITHPDDLDSDLGFVRQVLAGEIGTYSMEKRYFRKDGAIVWVGLTVSLVREPGGAPRYFIAVVEDISARKAAEAALRESEERFHLLVEGVSDHAIYMLDPHGRVLTWNRGAERITGYPEAEIRGRHYECFFTGDDRAAGEPRREIDVAAAEGRTAGEGWRVRRDGSRFHAAFSITALRDESGELRGFAKVTRDITERRAAEQTLAAYAERLEQLSRQLLEAQENERRHIARELHDEVGQLLTAVTLNLQSVCRRPEAAAVAPVLTASVEAVERVLARVRDLSLDLRPSLLDDLGLVPALRWYAGRQAQQSGVPVRLAVHDAERRFPPVVETACFRIAQEALTNALRHARAGAVDIALRVAPGAIEVEVRDDGAGFDAAAARGRAARGGSFGLLGMQERAELAGGALSLDSVPGQGTTVRARFPLPAATGAA